RSQAAGPFPVKPIWQEFHARFGTLAPQAAGALVEQCAGGGHGVGAADQIRFLPREEAPGEQTVAPGVVPAAVALPIVGVDHQPAPAWQQAARGRGEATEAFGFHDVDDAWVELADETQLFGCRQRGAGGAMADGVEDSNAVDFFARASGVGRVPWGGDDGDVENC